MTWRLVGLMLLAILSGPTASACTPDELEAKLTAVAMKIQELAQQDPQKVNEFSQKFAALQNGTQPASIDDLCKLYEKFGYQRFGEVFLSRNFILRPEEKELGTK